MFSGCWKSRQEAGRLKIGLGGDRSLAISGLSISSSELPISSRVSSKIFWTRYIAIRICGLKCILKLFQPGYSFIQTCIVRRALGKISNTHGAHGCPVPISFILVSIVLMRFICLLFSFTGRARSDLFEGDIIWIFLCIGYGRKEQY